LLLLSAGGFAGEKNLSNHDPVQGQKIRVPVLVECNYPPFLFRDNNNQMQGISIDFLKALEKKTALSFYWSPCSSFSENLKKVMTEEKAVMPNIVTTRKRLKTFLFTDPYLTIPAVILERRSEKEATGDITSKDLVGKTVSVGKGYAIADHLITSHPGILLREVDDDRAVLRKLALGEVDYAVIDIAVAVFMINEEKITNVRIAGSTDFKYIFRFAVSKNNLRLHKMLQNGLAQIGEEEKSEITRRWISVDYPGVFVSTGIWPIVLISMAVVVVLMFTAFFWSTMLRRQVFKRTVELKKLAEEREQLIDDLEAKNTELEQFVHSVSHDLRAPLVTIRGFLRLILESFEKKDYHEASKDIQRVLNSAATMNDLLEALLELSRAGRFSNQPEEIDMSELAGEAARLLENSTGTIAVDDNMPRVMGDRVRFLQVWQNLIDNAIKFSHHDREMKIHIGGSRDNGNLVFFVRDNGIGIAPEHKDSVFFLYKKLIPAIPGSGIGLAMVKKIIEYNKGSIWFESDETGTVFYFSFPA